MQQFLLGFVGRPLVNILKNHEGHFLAFVPEKPFPNKTEIMVTIGPGVRYFHILTILRIFRFRVRLEIFSLWKKTIFISKLWIVLK